MSNPFNDRMTGLQGPARDLMPITPDDGVTLSPVPVALLVEGAGVVAVETVAGLARTVTVADNTILPVGCVRVLATGTTATGIHGFVI